MKELIERLLYEEESATLDFKEEQYSLVNGTKRDKCEFVKDILALANAWRREDSYILIGVRDVKGGKSIVVGIPEDEQFDDAMLQQIVNNKINRPIKFEYKHIPIDGRIIGVIKIPLEDNIRPFYPKNDCDHIKKNEVKIRRGSATETVTPDEIVEMSIDRNKQKDSPILILEFADNKIKKLLGTHLEVESEFWNIKNIDKIPNFSSVNNMKSVGLGSDNTNYYKELVNFYQLKKLYVPISFSLYNDSNILAVDVKIEVEMDGNVVKLFKEKMFPKKPKTFNVHALYNANMVNNNEILPDITIEKRNEDWYLELMFAKIQPKQRLYSQDIIYFAAKGQVQLKYKIYADNLPEPIEGKLSINHSLKIEEKGYKDVLKYHGIDIDDIHDEKMDLESFKLRYKAKKDIHDT